jgi:hypothetical protein
MIVSLPSGLCDAISVATEFMVRANHHWSVLLPLVWTEYTLTMVLEKRPPRGFVTLLSQNDVACWLQCCKLASLQLVKNQHLFRGSRRVVE